MCFILAGNFICSKVISANRHFFFFNLNTIAGCFGFFFTNFF